MNWWARDVRQLPNEKQQQLLDYFGAARLEDLAAALWREMDTFSADAHAACRQSGVVYPEMLEQGVREHLKAMGAAIPTYEQTR